MIKEAEVEEELEFARYVGPDTRMYPSPRPDVKDLVLPPMKWVQVDEAYKKSGNFSRDRKKGVFEISRGTVSPDDLDLSIPDSLDRSLDNSQREFIRLIVLSTGELEPSWKSAMEVANNVDDVGIPRANSSVTMEFLRTRQRPFLQALQIVEGRYHKRKAVLALCKKHLSRIDALVAGRGAG